MLNATDRAETDSTSPTSPAVFLSDGCEAATPSTWVQTGTMHTIVMSLDPITAKISVDPSSICSGGSANLTVTFANNGPTSIVIPSPFFILSGGMDKWDLGTLDEVEVGPSQSVSVTATLPQVQPGDYGVFVYGYSPGGDITLVDPGDR